MKALRTAALALLFALLQGTEARAIIAGSDAAEGEYPWMAGIIRKGIVPGPGLIGGGVLVGDQWVVTTAHSLVNLSPVDLEVWMGTHDLGDASSRVAVNVLAIVRHPEFAIESGTSTHDLALLLLDRRISGISPIEILSVPSDLLVGDAVRVAGWGTVQAGQIVPHTILQEADAEILAENIAEQTFGPILNETHLAGVDPLEIATPCFGDSGGPLVRDFGGTDLLVGLVSFGTAECDDASQPTIYTRLSYFFSWVEERLAATESPPRMTVLGKGRSIASNEKPRLAKGSDFGTLKGKSASRTRSFRIVNQGSGWLTIQSANVSGRGFSLRSFPAPVLVSGAGTDVRVKWSNRSGKARSRGRLLIRTNQSDQPLYILRVEGRSD